jgi:hypothetical protein
MRREKSLKNPGKIKLFYKTQTIIEMLTGFKMNQLHNYREKYLRNAFWTYWSCTERTGKTILMPLQTTRHVPNGHWFFILGVDNCDSFYIL